MFYSPLSVEVALGMFYAGAAGETASQLKAALGAPDDSAEFHRGLGAVLGDLRSASGQGYTLEMANRIFTQRGDALLPDYTATMANDYGAPPQALDIRGDLEAARLVIDEWVAHQTHGEIEQLFHANELDALTSIVVASAMYFKADWAHAFPSAATHADAFKRADGSSVEVPMMSMPATELPVARIEGATALALPYRDSMISFIALLPDAADGVPALEHALAGMNLRALRAQLQSEKVALNLPRFKLHERLDLIPIMQKLGVTDLFERSAADLSGIHGRSDLYVKPLVHEASVSVDEVGTVAAAASGGAGVLRSGPRPIICDHPFVFLIYDDLTGTVLFTGRVADPSRD